MPEAVRRVVSVFQTTSDLLQQYQVHAEIQSQMFAYLFFFTNVSLFNQLIDKGETHTHTHTPFDIFSLSSHCCYGNNRTQVVCQQLQAVEKRGERYAKNETRYQNGDTDGLEHNIYSSVGDTLSQWTSSIGSFLRE